METRANYFVVGSFVLAMIAGLFVFIIWYAKYSDSKEYVKYTIYFRESVAGLSNGSLVRYRGIQVGTVIDIGINPVNVEEAKVLIEVGSDTPVRTDTVATLKYQGVTGIGYIELKGGTQDAPPLLPLGEESCATIPAEQSQLELLFESAPDLIAAFNKVAQSAQKLLSEENVKTISKTLENMQQFSDTLATNRKAIDTLLAKSSKTIATLDRELPETLRETRATAKSFAIVSAELAKILEESHAPLSTFANAGLPEAQLLLRDSRRMVEELNALSSSLKENPSQVIFSRERKGVKIP